MRENNKQASFTRQIPYLFSEHGITILKDGSVFCGLKLSGDDTFTLMLNELEAMKDQFCQVFRGLPEGYTVQLLHDYHEHVNDKIDCYAEKLKSPHPISTVFKNSFVNHLKNNTTNKAVDLYCFIIKPGKVKRQSFSQFLERVDAVVSGLKQRKVRKDKFETLSKQFAEATTELLHHCDRVQRAFESSLKFQVTKLDNSDLEKLIYKFINPGRTQAQQRDLSKFSKHQNHVRKFMTMRERLVCSPCHVYSDKLQLNKTYCKVLTMKGSPQTTVAADNDEFLYNVTFPFVFSFNFTILNTNSVNAKLEAKQKRKYAYIAGTDNPNLASSVSKTQIERAITDQKDDGFSWYDVSMSFLIQDTDLVALDEKADHIISRCARLHDLEIIEDTYRQLQYFLATLPGCGYLNDREHKMTTGNVNDLAPLSVPYKGTEQASLMFHSYRDTLFQFSTFSDDFNSWNQVVIGQTGSGKSFIVNNLLNASLMGIKTPRVMILDLGKSFKKITELWGGKYLTIDLDDPERGLNPLPPRASILDGEEFSSLGLLDFTVQLILMMVRNTQDDQLKARIVRKALLETYKMVKGRDPILSDLQRVLFYFQDISSDQIDVNIATTIAKYLDEYTEGAYAKIFNRPSDLTVESDFFCFDFKEAHSNPHIREIATYIIGGYICRKMVENPEPKFVIFDEFATTMQHETGSMLCKMIAKNCRKHGVSFICISQELGDFLNNKAAQTVYNQAKIKWFLNISDNLKDHQDHLRLNARDIEIIKKLKTVKGEYSQVYLIYDTKKIRLFLYPDPLMYWACTNDAKDNKMQNAYRDHFKTTGIYLYNKLAERYPHGVKDEDFTGDEIFKSAEALLCCA